MWIKTEAVGPGLTAAGHKHFAMIPAADLKPSTAQSFVEVASLTTSAHPHDKLLEKQRHILGADQLQEAGQPARQVCRKGRSLKGVGEPILLSCWAV